MELSKQFRDKLRALGPIGASLRKEFLPEIERLERALDLRDRRLTALETVSQLTSYIAGIESQDDVDRVLSTILSAALSLSRADRGFIVIVDREAEEGFSIKARMNSNDMAEDDIRMSRSLIRTILDSQEGIVTTNAQDDERFQATDTLLTADIRSVMAIPIKHHDMVIGGIYVDSQMTSNLFSKEDLETLNVFASNAAVALMVATAIRERRELHVQSVLALVNAVEAADAYTAGHSQNVGYYARGIAREMGYPADEVELVAFAGYLHDVGKIALQTPVGKAGDLDEEEWVEMRKHPIYGERILRDSPALAKILPAVRSHHERWDGRGYPDGLTGETIDPYARIITVADSFDAMTTDRPYRKAYSVEYALFEIQKGIDGHFQRAPAEAFLRAFQRGALRLAEKSERDKSLLDLLQQH